MRLQDFWRTTGGGWEQLTPGEIEALEQTFLRPSFGGLRERGPEEPPGYRRMPSKCGFGDVWMSQAGTGWQRASPPPEVRMEQGKAALEGRLVVPPGERAVKPEDPGRVFDVRPPAGQGRIPGELPLMPPIGMGTAGRQTQMEMPGTVQTISPLFAAQEEMRQALQEEEARRAQRGMFGPQPVPAPAPPAFVPSPVFGEMREMERGVLERQVYLESLLEAKKGLQLTHKQVFGLWSYKTGEPRARVRSRTGELVPWAHAKIDEMATELGFESGEQLLQGVREYVALEKTIKETRGGIAQIQKRQAELFQPFPGPEVGPEAVMPLYLFRRGIEARMRGIPTGLMPAQFPVDVEAYDRPIPALPPITSEVALLSELRRTGLRTWEKLTRERPMMPAEIRRPEEAEAPAAPPARKPFEPFPEEVAPAPAPPVAQAPAAPPPIEPPPPTVAAPAVPPERPAGEISAAEFRRLLSRGTMKGGRLQVPGLEGFSEQEIERLEAASRGLEQWGPELTDATASTRKLTSAQREAEKEIRGWTKEIAGAREKAETMAGLGEVPERVRAALGIGVPSAEAWERARVSGVMGRAGAPPGAGGPPGGPGGAGEGPWGWVQNIHWRRFSTGFGLWAIMRMQRLTIGQVQQWVSAYGEQERAAAAGAYQMGLAPPTLTGPALEIQQAGAARQQALANLGQGAFGVWRPLIQTVAQREIGPGVGAVLGGLLPSAGLVGAAATFGVSGWPLAAIAALPALALGGAYTYQGIQAQGGIPSMLSAAAQAIRQQGPLLGPPAAGGYGGGGGAGGVGPGAAMGMRAIVEQAAAGAGVAPSDAWGRAAAFMGIVGRQPTRAELLTLVHRGIMGQNLPQLVAQAGANLGLMPTQMGGLYQRMAEMPYQQAQLFMGQLERAAPVMGQMRQIWGTGWEQQMQVAGLPEPTQYRLGAALRGDPGALSWMLRQRAQQVRRQTWANLPTAAFGGLMPLQFLPEMAAMPYEMAAERIDPYDQLQRVWGVQDRMTALGRQYRDVGLGLQLQQLGAARAYRGRVYPLQDQLAALSFQGQQQAFAYQQQAGALQYRQFQEQWGLSMRGLTLQTGYQRERMADVYQMQMMRRGWTREDLELGESQQRMQWGWRQADISRALRRARGPERAELLRQREREQTLENLRRQQFERTRSRQEETFDWEDKRHSKEEEYFRKSTELQKERLDQQRQHFEERHSLQKKYQAAVKSAYEEEFHLRQQLTEEQRGWGEEQAKFQEDQIKARQAYNAEMDTLEDALKDVQREYAKAMAEIRKEFTEGEPEGTIYSAFMAFIGDAETGLDTVGDKNRALWEDFVGYIEAAQKKLEPPPVYVPPPIIKPWEEEEEEEDGEVGGIVLSQRYLLPSQQSLPLGSTQGTSLGDIAKLLQVLIAASYQLGNQLNVNLLVDSDEVAVKVVPKVGAYLWDETFQS